MAGDDYYSQELHGPYQLFDIGDFELEDGDKIRNCKLAYATFGRLSPQRDNAILILTWYSGTSKMMEQIYIGSGRAIDPENTLSSSPIRSATASQVHPITRQLHSTG